MERQRKTKVMFMLALMLVIVGMSLGFAAFSATLNISSSASVTPDSGSFYLGFYPSTTPMLDDALIAPTTSGGATGSSVTLSSGSTTISGLTANFTEPGQTITYNFYVGNESEYDAYLRGIEFLNVNGASSNKVCTAGNGATISLVESACNAISMTVNVNGTTATSTDTAISVNSVPKGVYVPVTITLTYASDGARADGPFNVSFGGVELDFSTVDGSSLITFTINSKQFYATPGMTLYDWINSEYNTDNYVIEEMSDCICTDFNGYPLAEGSYQIIEDGKVFSGAHCPC